MSLRMNSKIIILLFIIIIQKLLLLFYFIFGSILECIFNCKRMKLAGTFIQNYEIE